MSLLVYVHRADSEWFERANDCIRQLAERSPGWGVPWPCIHEFLSIVTHPRIFRPPTPLPDALKQVEIWMEAPTLHLLGEMKGHWKELKEALLKGRITGGGSRCSHRRDLPGAWSGRIVVGGPGLHTFWRVGRAKSSGRKKLIPISAAGSDAVIQP